MRFRLDNAVAEDDQDRKSAHQWWNAIQTFCIVAVLAIVIAEVVLVARDHGIAQRAFKNAEEANTVAGVANMTANKVGPY